MTRVLLDAHHTLTLPHKSHYHAPLKERTRPSQKPSEIPAIHRTARPRTSSCLRDRPSPPSGCHRVLSQGGGESLRELQGGRGAVFEGCA